LFLCMLKVVKPCADFVNRTPVNLIVQSLFWDFLQHFPWFWDFFELSVKMGNTP